MAHIRRGFSKALDAGERDAARIIYLISYLYHIEDWVRMSNQNKKSGPALRDAIRASHCAPRLKLIEKYLRKIQSRHLSKRLMGKAITYAMNQWSGLESYLKDGRVELDNNLCENTIRPLKIGAKNYLFFGSRRGWRRTGLRGLHSHRDLQAPRSGPAPLPHQRHESAR